MTNKEIAVLVKKVQKDKKNSFEELYRGIWNTVYYFCYKSLGNEQDAKDAMQTVFMQLYNQIDTLRVPDAFNKFLHIIMRATCSNFYKLKEGKDTDEIEVYESVPEEKAEFLPSEAYERQDVRDEIAKMIENLPAKQREAILLFYYDGMSIKEIAEITDSKFDAVNNRLVTARKSLRERAEMLIKKGALNYTMAIIPIPILTRILREEAQQIATSEICELAWQGICASCGIVIAGIAGAAAATTTTSTTTAAGTAAASSVFTNVAICLTCAAVVATGGFLAYYVNDNFINPPVIEEVYNYDVSYETDEYDFDSEYLINLIRSINNSIEFMEFVDVYDAVFLSGASLVGAEEKMLFYIEETNRFIYFGYVENVDNGFRVVYETTEDRISFTDEQVDEWFGRMQ
ncbi:MAG: sigma-70 family RNA polymerase sigma factor [Oscillospiraceae bacterium]|nr:sigma-70 family RNA polymerase sigma factor [Oscillospiraceae bacterium]